MVHVLRVIDAQALILSLVKSLSSREIPELVKESIVFLFLKSLNDSVQIFLANMPHGFLAEISNFDIDNFFSCLYSSGQLRINALTN